MNQLALFDAPLAPPPAAPRFRCNVGLCDDPAQPDSIFCAHHQAHPIPWPFPDLRCRAWGCKDYAQPFGNGALCRAHVGMREEWAARAATWEPA